MSYNKIELFSPLYKRDSKGEIRRWNMEIGFNSDNEAAHRTVAGIDGGKLVTSEWKVTEPKNVGRSNATTALEQAFSEIESLYTIKRETGYFDNKEDVDKFTKFKPMLAKEYNVKALDKMGAIYSQPKLDGIRCIARADGLWTRSGKEIVSCPHIVEALAELFEANPDLILDGELYNHDLKDDFNKITSTVRKTKLKPADIETSRELVQYHVYDMYSDKSFFERITELESLGLSDPIVLVETAFVTDTESIDRLYGQYLEAGYEGQMIRDDQSYENKRSKYLLKRKEFITEEYGVCGVSEGQGNWSGAIKRFHLYDAHGVGFDAGVRGTYEQMKELFESGVQPEWATLRYFALTPDGIPRFPVVIDWGTGKRED